MTLDLRRWLPAAVLACLVFVISAGAAPAPGPTTDPKKGETPAEKINKALDETGDFTIENGTLQSALTDIAEKGKFNLVLDRFTLLNQLGIDPNNAQFPVNLKLTNVKTRTALRSVLAQYNLGYAVIGDTVVVTMEEQATHRQLKQRVTVDLDKTPASAAFKQLSRETGTNLLVDSRLAKEAQTPVTLQIDDVPLDTAVRLISEMAALKVVRVGNVLFITNKATAQEMRQDPDLQGAGPQGQSPTDPLMNRDIQKLLLQQGNLQFQLVQPLAVPVNPPPLPR